MKGSFFLYWEEIVTKIWHILSTHFYPSPYNSESFKRSSYGYDRLLPFMSRLTSHYRKVVIIENINLPSHIPQYRFQVDQKTIKCTHWNQKQVACPATVSISLLPWTKGERVLPPVMRPTDELFYVKETHLKNKSVSKNVLINYYIGIFNFFVLQ